MLCTETYFKFNNKDRFKAKGWEKIFRTNIKQTNPRVGILRSKEVNLKITDKKGQCTLIKLLIHHEDVKILIVYSPSNRDSKFVKQNLMS